MAGKLLPSVHVGEKVKKEATWKKLILCWRDVLNQYLKSEKRYDIPHWHIERSHTGFLAAAVWNMGGVALEEYSVERRRIKRRKRRSGKSGRCDLYFHVAGLDCSVEAKHDWTGEDSDKCERRIKRKLGAAKRQLCELPAKERASCGLAVCWAVPYLQSDAKNDTEVLERIASRFEDADSIVAVYHVPLKDRQVCEREYDKQHTHPGVVFIGRFIW